MLVARLALHPFFRSVRFAHKSPKASSAAANKNKSKAKEEFVYEDYAARLNNCQLEFSSGAGGTESMLFAGEIFEMYRLLCAKRGWAWQQYEFEQGPIGGLRSAIVSISGIGAYSVFRFEAGVHRVQRIPVTDKSRMHTSTASLAVLPEPEESQISFAPDEVKLETMRSSGPGGQNVNKKSSAVRLTHLSTGIAVKVMDERFQHMNLKIAYKRLAALLMQQKIDAQESRLTSSRRLQVGSKARAEKIRTYNFKDNRITDHRLRLSVNDVEDFLKAGEGLDQVIEELQIPGDGGSSLDANLTGKPSVVHYICDSSTKDYFDLWLNLESFVPLLIDCWTDNMKLVWNNVTKRSENAPGVDVKVPGFGGTSSVEWLDPSKRSPGRYFQPIVDALSSWGYTRGKNVVGAPFDWRRSPPELTGYYTMLRTLITVVYKYNNNQKIIIIGHSMGNPIMNYFYHNFVDKEWKDKYIHSHISLSGPYAGAMQIVKLFASGYNMDYYRIILPPSELRPMQRSFTSSAFLFPSESVWNETEPFAITADRNYTVKDIETFFKDVGYETGFDQYQMAHPTLLTNHPGVTTHCIYGHSVQTPELLTWAKGYFPDYQPTITYGDGDGTVNRRSLEICKRWQNESAAGTVTVHELENADHLGILGDPRTIQLIKDILYNPPVKQNA
ncbi:hypothetical protein M3Y97_00433100 [Aphelenchoides bicaudatus]|nr:hypothetical protein M3Y97_00433100 [Aphelenchoides bicaudatus]